MTIHPVPLVCVSTFSQTSHRLDCSLWFHDESLNRRDVCGNPTVLFFFKMVLTILVPLLCHGNFRTSLSFPPSHPPTPTKKGACWAFVWDYIGSIAQLGVGGLDILTLLSLPIQGHRLALHLFIYLFYGFCHQCLIVFTIQI